MRPFVLITGLFFLWGIPNNLNDVLIRQFMKSLELSRFQAGLVQSAFYLGYFLLALPAGLLMKRHGYKPGFLTGLFLFATGCFLFLPAANSGRYGFFLAALFVMASGLAFLETASNPFVAQLGPMASSEHRLNLAQAFNPLGCITGILVGTAFIFSGVELSHTQVAAMQAAGTYAAYLHKETMRVVAPYFALGGLALLWAIMIGVTRFPAFLEARSHPAEVSGDWRELLHQAPFPLRRSGAVFIRGRFGLHLELFHSVRERICPYDRPHRRNSVGVQHRSLRHWTLRSHCPDAPFFTGQDYDNLRPGQCCSAAGGSSLSRVGWGSWGFC